MQNLSAPLSDQHARISSNGNVYSQVPNAANAQQSNTDKNNRLPPPKPVFKNPPERGATTTPEMIIFGLQYEYERAAKAKKERLGREAREPEEWRVASTQYRLFEPGAAATAGLPKKAAIDGIRRYGVKGATGCLKPPRQQEPQPPAEGDTYSDFVEFICVKNPRRRTDSKRGPSSTTHSAKSRQRNAEENSDSDFERAPSKPTTKRRQKRVVESSDSDFERALSRPTTKRRQTHELRQTHEHRGSDDLERKPEALITETVGGRRTKTPNGKGPIVRRDSHDGEHEEKANESDNCSDPGLPPPAPEHKLRKHPVIYEDQVNESDDNCSDSDFTPPDPKPKPNQARDAEVRCESLLERKSPPKLRQKSLRFLLESTKYRWDLPRPSIRDPPARTFGCNYFQNRDPELVPARWPSDIFHLADNYNPDEIRIPGGAPFQEKCYCVRAGDCRWKTCANSLTEVYCDALCCPFKGLCGNGTLTNENIQLMRVRYTDSFTLQATKYIASGVVLGEYLGILSLVPGGKRDRQENEGFRLHFHEDPAEWGTQRLCVDAQVAGSLMRFLNHSCSPSAKFRELTNQGGRTMVATACRDIFAGEEITVDYGDDLWFDCKCDVCETRGVEGKAKKK